MANKAECLNVAERLGMFSAVVKPMNRRIVIQPSASARSIYVFLKAILYNTKDKALYEKPRLMRAFRIRH
jgi:hypothetical protein